MSTVKTHTNKDHAPKAKKKGADPFRKLMDDKERIADAVNKDQPLTSLTDIKFVRPV